MSWSNWWTRGPSLKQEPTPEPAPPSFHKPRSESRPPKPYAVEWRYLRWKGPLNEWQVLKRYETEEARDRALAKFMRVDHRPGRMEYRAGEP